MSWGRAAQLTDADCEADERIRHNLLFCERKSWG